MKLWLQSRNRKVVLLAAKLNNVQVTQLGLKPEKSMLFEARQKSECWRFGQNG